MVTDRPRLHYQPAALLVAEAKLPGGGRLGCFPNGRARPRRSVARQRRSFSVVAFFWGGRGFFGGIGRPHRKASSEQDDDARPIQTGFRP